MEEKKPPTRICGTWVIEGNAADMVLDHQRLKIERDGLKQYGKELAIRDLLNELWRIRKGVF